MRRPGRTAPETQASKRADPNDDGSDGRFVRGLPADVSGFPVSAPIDYQPQAGTTSEHSGGLYETVTLPRNVPPTIDHRPFKLK
jgi:hypothetical protein